MNRNYYVARQGFANEKYLSDQIRGYKTTSYHKGLEDIVRSFSKKGIVYGSIPGSTSWDCEE